jgi:hypothetical protein
MRRRVRTPIPSAGLSAKEMSRIGALLVLMALVGSAILKARDPRMWTWLAPAQNNSDEATQNSKSEIAPARAPSAVGEDLASIPPPGPSESSPSNVEPQKKSNDADPAEWEDAQREFQVLTDKAEYTAPEMFSYWRLMRWQLSQTDHQLLARAAKSVTFRQLFMSPDVYRGKLIRLKLRFAQAVVSQLKPSENLLELPLERIFEVQGWNDESQPYCFSLVTHQLPRGMHAGTKLSDEGEFVGYFHKLILFEDHLGKSRAAPVLIGRIVSLVPQTAPVQNETSPIWFWGTATVFLCYLVARFGLPWLFKSKPKPVASRPKLNTLGEEVPSVVDWLEELKTSEPNVPPEPRE